MRAVLMRTGLVISVMLCACDAYDEDLGPTPFLCGPDDACPSGYTCEDDPANGQKVCVGSDDSISGNFNCNDDGDHEPNGMLALAEMAALDAMKTFALEDLAVCPAGDRDLYGVTIATAGQHLEATITFQANGAALSAAILNTGGVPIANGSIAAGAATTVRVSERELPAGLYYVQVTADPGGSLAVNNYQLELAVTGP